MGMSKVAWSLYTIFILIGFHILISLQEMGKGSIVFHELSVRANLCDLAVCHHHYDITLGEEPNPMSHKDTNLHKYSFNFRY